MPNTSATGGYLLPTNTPLPGSLTLEQFIHSVMVGVSGLASTLVRPRWQPAPPKMPDITVNWMAFGVQINATGANAFVERKDANTSTLGRQEELEIQISFYGPNALENMSAFRDGFQIQQNLEALMLANMGFTGCSNITRAPELINERWFNRTEMTLVLARRVVRSYEILSFASAGGIIHTDQEYNSNWETPEAP